MITDDVHAAMLMPMAMALDRRKPIEMVLCITFVVALWA